MQEEAADIWKENMIENLKAEALEFKTIGEFLEEIKKEFEERDEELKQVAELKELKQRQWTMEEFIQMFRRAAKGSGYKGQVLIEEYKRGIDERIRRRLMEAEYPPKRADQWYERVERLDRSCRESRREEEEKRRGLMINRRKLKK